jgi:hypothetical protein
MANFNPLSSSVSFDDLLKANKQQFDRIFSAQTEELGVLGVNHRPPTNADLTSASLASAAGAPSDVYAALNERFGSGWSSEVIEHKTERGSVTVLCKLTVNGRLPSRRGLTGRSGHASPSRAAAHRPKRPRHPQPGSNAKVLASTPSRSISLRTRFATRATKWMRYYSVRRCRR